MIGAMNDFVYVCAPAPLQYGVAVGIQTLGGEFYQELQRSFQCKRDQFCRVLQAIGLSPTILQGAYYVLADVRWLPGRTGNISIRKDWGGRGGVFSRRPWCSVYSILFC